VFQICYHRYTGTQRRTLHLFTFLEHESESKHEREQTVERIPQPKALATSSLLTRRSSAVRERLERPRDSDDKRQDRKHLAMRDGAASAARSYRSRFRWSTNLARRERADCSRAESRALARGDAGILLAVGAVGAVGDREFNVAVETTSSVQLVLDQPGVVDGSTTSVRASAGRTGGTFRGPKSHRTERTAQPRACRRGGRACGEEVRRVMTAGGIKVFG
jgi:hypothetical protein